MFCRGHYLKSIVFSPANTILEFEPLDNVEADVYDANGEVVPNMKGLPKDSSDNLCGLKINGITEESFGKWKCILNGDSGYEYLGAFTMLTKEEIYVKDVRLPLHIVPEHYDLHLNPTLTREENFTTTGTVSLEFSVQQDPNWEQTVSCY